ncbi:hypothetical protein C900_02141 [Fulvivirga imtechensis AK7]|uniref:Uncharacterized protein n=1 Tax=Fulvivirga imtechensis AK7 TaxID=1237149 RepID=L8JXF3_9BACT|nr:hypothetical protein C900_02141 [Fulvivirga imtechensis AK7]
MNWLTNRVSNSKPSISNINTATRIAVSRPNPFLSSHAQTGYRTKLISNAKLTGMKTSLPKYKITDP